jgi:hypothetical protein
MVSDCTRLLGNHIENAVQGIDLHCDHVIVSNNIVTNAFIGMKAMHGSRNVLISGNHRQTALQIRRHQRRRSEHTPQHALLQQPQNS